MFAQIKLYIAIGIAAVIIALLLWLGIERGRNAKLSNQVKNLEYDNKLAAANTEVKQNTITIQEHFVEVKEKLIMITNTNALDEQTQAAVDSIMEAYYK